MINQVVVLCGGRGKRLKPLTDKVPTPMININGVPFLWYFLKQLSAQGHSLTVVDQSSELIQKVIISMNSTKRKKKNS